MAKPRIFVSSTYYDLKHIRASLEAFINSFGYEPVLFENGDILFSHDKPLDESCYAEIENSHMQILIIGGYYGSAATGEVITDDQKQDQYVKFNSITRKEFEVALGRQIPIFFFVDAGVLAEYNTYKKNRENPEVIYAHVDSINVFVLLDDIFSLKQGNFVQGFSKFSDISEWLRIQWAHMMAEFISNKSKQIELKTLTNSLANLETLTDSLKEYTEAILNKVEPVKAKQIKSNEIERSSKLKSKRLTSSKFMSYVAPNLDRTLSEEDIYDRFIGAKTGMEFIKSVSLPGVTYSEGYQKLLDVLFLTLKSDLDE
jgi:hypothetical protein